MNVSDFLLRTLLSFVDAAWQLTFAFVQFSFEALRATYIFLNSAPYSIYSSDLGNFLIPDLMVDPPSSHTS